MSCQPHRVTSGQSNSAISKLCTCQNCVNPFSSQDKQTLSSVNIHLKLFLTILVLNQQAQYAHGVNTRFSRRPLIKTLALTQCLANYFCQQTNLPPVKAELYQNSLALVTTPTQDLLPNLTRVLWTTTQLSYWNYSFSQIRLGFQTRLNSWSSEVCHFMVE